MIQQDLRSLNPTELGAAVAAAGEPRFRTEQVFRWLHGHAVSSLDEMTNVPRRLREKLAEAFALRSLTVDVEQKAADGTRKFRFCTHDDRRIESVLIPEEPGRLPAETPEFVLDEDEQGEDGDNGMRGAAPESPGKAGAPAAGGARVGGAPGRTGVAQAPGRNKLALCVSSQVGCALDCRFCATATLGYGRNLSAGEIVEQVYTATARAGRRPTNLVFMGMGEPLHNFEQVTRAFGLLVHPWGAGFSPRRITVSTAGLVPGIQRLSTLSPLPNLAISLNATTDDVRDDLMPINRKWPIGALMDAVRGFPLGHGRKLTFEYVLLAGVNDSDADAHRLPKLVKGLACMINVIPWNPFPGTPFKRPSAERIRSFQDILRGNGLQVYIRTPRGDDIDAACGQLAARPAGDALVELRRSTGDGQVGPS